jgi:hypothetical protein
VGTRKVYSDSILNMMLQGRRGGVYKSRVASEHSGPDGGPIETQDLSWAKEKLMAMMERRAPKADDA